MSDKYIKCLTNISNRIALYELIPLNQTLLIVQITNSTTTQQQKTFVQIIIN
jgi:hypothetical protein